MHESCCCAAMACQLTLSSVLLLTRCLSATRLKLALMQVHLILSLLDSLSPHLPPWAEDHLQAKMVPSSPCTAFCTEWWSVGQFAIHHLWLAHPSWDLLVLDSVLVCTRPKTALPRGLLLK